MNSRVAGVWCSAEEWLGMVDNTAAHISECAAASVLLSVSDALIVFCVSVSALCSCSVLCAASFTMYK